MTRDEPVLIGVLVLVVLVLVLIYWIISVSISVSVVLKSDISVIGILADLLIGASLLVTQGFY